MGGAVPIWLLTQVRQTFLSVTKQDRQECLSYTVPKVCTIADLELLIGLGELVGYPAGYSKAATIR